MIDYTEYMQSDEWKRKRTRIRRRARGWCERCGVNRRYAIHHLTYERLGCEELGDLLAVCQGCHDFLHGKSDYDPAAVSYTKEELGWMRWFMGQTLSAEEIIAYYYVEPVGVVAIEKYLWSVCGSGISWHRVAQLERAQARES